MDLNRKFEKLLSPVIFSLLETISMTKETVMTVYRHTSIYLVQNCDF